MVESETTRAEQAHPHLPSAKWAAHRKAIDAVVTRTASERAERMKERTDGTEYHRNAETTTGGP